MLIKNGGLGTSVLSTTKQCNRIITSYLTPQLDVICSFPKKIWSKVFQHIFLRWLGQYVSDVIS